MLRRLRIAAAVESSFLAIAVTRIYISRRRRRMERKMRLPMVKLRELRVLLARC